MAKYRKVYEEDLSGLLEAAKRAEKVKKPARAIFHLVDLMKATLAFLETLQERPVFEE